MVFTRVRSRKLSKNKQDLLDNELEKHLVIRQRFSFDFFANKSLSLEIGCGSGENIIHQALNKPSKYYIASELYKKGIASLLEGITKMDIKNIFIWPYDFNLLLDMIPDHTLNEVYILFPDPWPKARHNKRKLIYASDMQKLTSKLKDKGNLYFTSDILDYVIQAKQVFSSYLTNVTQDESKPYECYTKTKYNKKADSEGRKSYYLTFANK